MRRRTSPWNWTRGFGATALFVNVLVRSVNGQVEPPNTPHPLSVNISVDAIMEPRNAQPSWRVSDAWLEEQFQDTWGYIKITNTSAVALNSTRFYAEYYDEAGRLSFTLPFTQDENMERVHGSFEPGETRTLASLAQMAPSTRPKNVRIHVINEASGSAEVPCPAAIFNGDERDVESIHLKPSDQTLIPIALVEATVDARGPASSFRVLAARDGTSKDWAQRMVSKLRFEPATRDGQRISQKTLILIRAAQFHPLRSIPAGVVYEDPWIQSYVATAKGDRLPFVNLLRIDNQEDSDVFRYFSMGTDWGINVFEWVPDSVHGGTRRAWTQARKPK